MPTDIPFSGTAEFPEVPAAALPPRPAFAMQPWQPENLCPALDVDVDVIPPPRAIPEFIPPVVKEIRRVPKCTAIPATQDCISFSPLSALAFEFNGRRFFGNNIMDRAWCTLTSFMNMSVNTALQWRVEPCTPGENILDTKRVAVYGGQLIASHGGWTKRTTNWPSGVAGAAAAIIPLAEDPTALNTIPDGNSVSGFWNSIPKTSADLAKSQHPLFIPGNFTDFGAILPEDAYREITAEGLFRICFTVPEFPACVYYRNDGTNSGPSGSGTVLVKSTAAAAEDFDSYSCTVLALLGADGRILQQHSGPIEERADPLPYQVVVYGSKVLVYLPTITDSSIWKRNGTKAAANPNLAGAIGPGGLGGWYELGSRNILKTAQDVWVYLISASGTANESTIVNIGSCKIQCGLFKPDSVAPAMGRRKIASFPGDGTVSQCWTGMIDQHGPLAGDADREAEDSTLPAAKKFKSVTTRASADAPGEDNTPPSRLPSLYGFREGVAEPFPTTGENIAKFMVPARKNDEAADEVSMAWFTLADLLAAGGGSGRFPGAWHAEADGYVITFSECIYQRGPMVKIFGAGPDHQLVHTVASDAAVVYLGLQIDTENGDVAIIEGSSLDSIVFGGVPADPQYIRKPLYRVAKSNGVLVFEYDYRNIPEVVLRT